MSGLSPGQPRRRRSLQRRRQFECLYFLRSNVPWQEQGTVGSHPEPPRKAHGAPQTFRAQHTFGCVIADSEAVDRRIDSRHGIKVEVLPIL